MKHIAMPFIWRLILGITLTTFLFVNCKKNIKSELVVYENSFETSNTNDISSGVIEVYNGSKVLGRYNAGGFKLALKNLPQHKLATISFDLYIHDNWNGNTLGANNVDGPDLWTMTIDNQVYINTTFSNAACMQGTICPPQSYPANYPNNNNNPRSGASNVSLPGVCGAKGDTHGTTQYQIQKTISHSAETLTLECLDKLLQKNVTDPKCDASWSVDNVKISVINL